MAEKYIIANYKSSGFFYKIISLTENELGRWVDFFRDRVKEATSWDDDSFSIWEYNEANLYYATNFRDNYAKIVGLPHPTDLIETMLVM